MNQEPKTALLAAESVAHLQGSELEILPLADYARGQAARIAELEVALTALLECAESVADTIPVHNRHTGVSQAIHVSHKANHLAQHCKPAREVLNRTITPTDSIP